VGESGATLAAAMAEILRIVEDCNWRRRKSNKLKKIHKRKREIYTLKITQTPLIMRVSVWFCNFFTAVELQIVTSNFEKRIKNDKYSRIFCCGYEKMAYICIVISRRNDTGVF